MADESNTLDIVLQGREYHVACAPGERAALRDAVAFLDDKMKALAAKTGGSGEKLAVMTALNIAHELLSHKLPDGSDLRETRRRITAMEAKLDSAMTQQEKLF